MASSVTPDDDAKSNCINNVVAIEWHTPMQNLKLPQVPTFNGTIDIDNFWFDLQMTSNVTPDHDTRSTQISNFVAIDRPIPMQNLKFLR